jgi:hypothetical protein
MRAAQLCTAAEVPTPPVTAQVGNDHAMSGCEMLDYRLKHLAGDHQPMHEQEGRPRSALGEVEKAMRHFKVRMPANGEKSHIRAVSKWGSKRLRNTRQMQYPLDRADSIAILGASRPTPLALPGHFSPTGRTPNSNSTGEPSWWGSEFCVSKPARQERILTTFQGTWEKFLPPYRWRFGQVGGFSET